MGPEAIRERTKRKEGVALGPPPRSVLCGFDANCEAIHGSDTYLTNWPLSLGRGYFGGRLHLSTCRRAAVMIGVCFTTKLRFCRLDRSVAGLSFCNPISAEMGSYTVRGGRSKR